MTDTTTTIAELKKHIQDFSDERGWYKEQNAKDLVMALNVEAAELAEIFMWLHSDKADSVKDDAQKYQQNWPMSFGICAACVCILMST